VTSRGRIKEGVGRFKLSAVIYKPLDKSQVSKEESRSGGGGSEWDELSSLSELLRQISASEDR
jgi:hypothetical protein